jgi:hypothetical protein
MRGIDRLQLLHNDRQFPEAALTACSSPLREGDSAVRYVCNALGLQIVLTTPGNAA